VTVEWDVIDTPVGSIFVAAGPKGIVALALADDPAAELEALAARAGLAGAEPVQGGERVAIASARILDYFAGRCPDVALEPGLESTTEFVARVREVVRAIPPGSTMTYGDVAAAAGHPRAARAVGNVMRANPVLLAIPCHRVVASNGPGGFGRHPEVKRWLLAHERDPRSD
jgi:O-6-methylguanine DNA methyltransferase